MARTSEDIIWPEGWESMTPAQIAAEQVRIRVSKLPRPLVPDTLPVKPDGRRGPRRREEPKPVMRVPQTEAEIASWWKARK